ncbi:MAG: prolyl oligopeptidase family serine peptidase [Bryobacterales bacterium]|nr:prolyl oligopeptidase family serine peptidase [Bryobacterales bacterium]
MDKVVYTSKPRHYVPYKTAPGTLDPMIVYACTFIPRTLDKSKKHPLLVYVHGGVHSDFKSGGSGNSAGIVRELITQGYVIVAPEYRGSTGYNRGYYDAIDYGGTKNDDVFASREWMLERYSFLDPKKVGILGWSHIFSACSHIGKTVDEDIGEYLRRSPYTHAAKLATPLLTNDEDVNVLEVRRLIDALKAAGKTRVEDLCERPRRPSVQPHRYQTGAPSHEASFTPDSGFRR